MGRRRLGVRSLFLWLLCTLCLGACGSKLTNDNFTLISHGMTEAEVKDLIGKPNEVKTSKVLGLSGTTYKYESGGSRASITFINGKVVDANGEFK
ncbi:MAG: hypothetical protein AAGA18_04025 [Verrucomicrobiota bacterium]